MQRKNLDKGKEKESNEMLYQPFTLMPDELILFIANYLHFRDQLALASADKNMRRVINDAATQHPRLSKKGDVVKKHAYIRDYLLHRKMTAIHIDRMKPGKGEKCFAECTSYPNRLILSGSLAICAGIASVYTFNALGLSATLIKTGLLASSLGCFATSEVSMKLLNVYAEKRSERAEDLLNELERSYPLPKSMNRL